MQLTTMPAVPSWRRNNLNIGICAGLGLALAWLWSLRISCTSSLECTEANSSMPRQYHGYVAIGLLTLLMRESATLVSAFFEPKDTQEVWTTNQICSPSLLLCIVFTVLITAEITLAMTVSPWAHAMPAVDGLTHPWRPVHTLRYAEWCLNVPVLMTLAGHCALGRPIREVLMPIIVTDVYIVFAWAAMVTPSFFVRWFLVAATFVAYGYASVGMTSWVFAFMKTSPLDTSLRFARASLVAMLVCMFGVYGVIYLLALTGSISAHREQLCNTMSGFATKATMGTVFAVLRSHGHRHRIATLLPKVTKLNMTFMSILKSRFDIVLPCVVTPSGSCILSGLQLADASELEYRLGRPVGGIKLETLLAGAAMRERFTAYVRNVIMQADRLQTPGCNAPWSPQSDPFGAALKGTAPVASILQCSMESCKAGELGLVSATIHISCVPKASTPLDRVTQHIVAIYFDPLESMPYQKQMVVPEWLVADCHSQTALRQASDRVMPSDSVSQVPDQSVTSTARLQSPEKKCTANSSTVRKRCALVKEATARADVVVAGKSPKCKSEDDSSRGASDTCKDSGPSESKASASTTILTIKGGSDVGSQASKTTIVGSVHLACRQLLGCLLDEPPPLQFISRRIEDHLGCALEMVRLKGPAAIAWMKYDKDLLAWKSRCRDWRVTQMLMRAKAPNEHVDESLWRSEILAGISKSHPGARPDLPVLTYDNKELWLQAWKNFYEVESQASSEENS